ncbi:death-associated protein kinase 1-like, partial [Saccoglossus kowalevskii]|uniref:Death-associated protein kinase 1-like n=1 Tax=Saccoglossus kowalevskii TaxID=10224 RepID=A0ABM0M1J2_SACKO
NNENALFNILRIGTSDIQYTQDKDRALEIINILLDSGIDVTSPNEEGETPTEFATSRIGTRSGYFDQFYSEAEHTFLKVQQERRHTALMMEPGIPIDRMKLYVCGYGGTGKTTLIKSLLENTNWIHSLLRTLKPNRGPHPGQDEHIATSGIDIQDVDVPGIGKLSIWEFAGQSEFFFGHSFFLHAETATFIVLYKIADSNHTECVVRPNDMVETAIEQVTDWFKMFKANNPPSDRELINLSIILVASRGDWVKIGNYEHEAQRVAELVKSRSVELFQGLLNVINVVLVLDCHDPDSNGMKILRKILKDRRKETIQKLEHMPNICGHILVIKRKWTLENTLFPVMYWKDYVKYIREKTRSILKEEFLMKATEYLHNLGMILYMKGNVHNTCQEVVIMSPQWFCGKILGPMLASGQFHQYRFKLEKKQIYTKEDIDIVLGGAANSMPLIELLVAFEIVFPLKEGDYGFGRANQYIISSMLPDVMPSEQWRRNTRMQIYYGRRYECHSFVDMFSRNFFPQLQTRLHGHFTAIGRPPSGIWRNGIKVCKVVEGLVLITADGRAVNIVTRCENESQIGDCYELMELVSYDTRQVLHSACPGVEVDRYILSAEALRNHHDLKEVGYYSMQAICDADNNKSAVYDAVHGREENVTDLLVPGFDQTILKENGNKCDVKWLIQST